MDKITVECFFHYKPDLKIVTDCNEIRSEIHSVYMMTFPAFNKIKISATIADNNGIHNICYIITINKSLKARKCNKFTTDNLSMPTEKTVTNKLFQRK